MDAVTRRVAKAIDAVQLFVRYNDWASDSVSGWTVEICRHGKGREPDVVVVRRFRTGTDESKALRKTVSEQRAIAAIAAMKRKPLTSGIRT